MGEVGGLLAMLLLLLLLEEIVVVPCRSRPPNLFREKDPKEGRMGEEHV